MNNSVYNWNGYTFNNVNCILGTEDNAKYLYDCTIRDSYHNTIGVVLIFANKFSEAKWHMMDYLKKSLSCRDTEQSDVKQFLPSNNLDEHDFYVHVVRCD